jgi:hypothetical protein
MEEQTVQESEYVLAVLCQMRDKMSANPNLFEPDAQERLAEAIARVDNGLRSIRLMIGSVEQDVKSA